MGADVKARTDMLIDEPDVKVTGDHRLHAADVEAGELLTVCEARVKMTFEADGN